MRPVPPLEARVAQVADRVAACDPVAQVGFRVAATVHQRPPQVVEQICG